MERPLARRVPTTIAVASHSPASCARAAAASPAGIDVHEHQPRAEPFREDDRLRDHDVGHAREHADDNDWRAHYRQRFGQ
ncbi:hypothetical protein [Subtercola vilae]|uniref:hypothetical protein n=1 Tax=Subtercola vilae TaxID=2056433 RepID=UPI001F3D8BA1|nr:hypothetical protein [Subtercola vilae]